jgi:glycosyltransferase involved in cell wall biosynthesis
MVICHIINNLKGGGMQNLLLSLAIRQVHENCDVYIITIDKDGLEYSKNIKNKLQTNDVKVISLNRIIGSKFSAIRKILHCRGIIKKIQPDIINTHGQLSHIFGKLATFKTDIRNICTIHNAPERWGSICTLLNRRTPLIFCSEAASELRIQKNNNTIIIPNGVNPQNVNNKNVTFLRKEFNLSDESKLIVSVGSLRPQKNYEFLIALAKSVLNENLHFFICGGHYGKGYINKEIFKDISNIHLLGLRSDVSEIQNECDCFLSCSTFEGLPIAVLEAFFVGLPCVLSPIIQHKKIAKDIEGCYIPKDFTTTSFKESLQEATNKQQSKHETLKKREKVISKYLIEETANSYISFYKSILNEKRE